MGLAACGNDASGRPLASGMYSVAYNARLTSGVHYPDRSDGYHFQKGNRQLYEAMQSDPQFSASMEAMYPGITGNVQPGPRGTFPRQRPHPDLTWHHDAHNEGGLQLIPSAQHRAPGPVRANLHPNQQGGM